MPLRPLGINVGRLRLKLTVTVSTLMVGVAATTTLVTAVILIPLSEQFTIERTRHRAMDLATLSSKLLAQADVLKIQSKEDEKTATFAKLQTILNDIIASTDGARYAYIWKLTADPRSPFGIRAMWVVDNERIGSKMFKEYGKNYPVSKDSAESLWQVLKTKAIWADRKFYTDYAGTWISGYAPITTDPKDGGLIIVGIDTSSAHIEEIRGQMLLYILAAAVTCLLVITPFGILLGLFTARPLKSITRRMQQLSVLDLNDSDNDIPAVWVIEIEQARDALNTLTAAMRSFALYLPQDVVKQLLASNNVARIGGNSTNLAVMFSDIRNFTHYAESAETSALLEKLNEYFNRMTGAIVEHQGTVDKFIGDAIMAYWGAPNAHPTPASAACHSALKMRALYTALNAEWKQAGAPFDFYTRIGIHFGAALVGNMGSNERINYTAIGDTINTASRLEPLGKSYGVDIVVSEAVVEAVQAEGQATAFSFRPLDTIQVRGKSTQTTIYALDESGN